MLASVGASSQQCYTTMFADIVASTQIYEKFGNVEAQFAITQSLSLVSNIVERNNGRTIKMAGDDVLSIFPSADDAINAACGIHETFAEDMLFDGLAIRFHVGIHTGEGVITDDDIYGDCVNMAARLTNMAKSEQTLISGDAAKNLTNKAVAVIRPYDTVKLRGSSKAVNVFDVIWKSSGEETGLMDLSINRNGTPKSIKLKFQGNHFEISTENHEFIIGREETNHLSIIASMISRQHAVVEFYRHKFVIKDISTNGTYIRTQAGNDVYIKNEVYPLIGKGELSMGKLVDDQPELNIHFDCTTVPNK